MRKYETFNYGYDGHSNSGIFNWWAADNAPVAAQQQTQQVKQTRKRQQQSVSLNKVYMRCVTAGSAPGSVSWRSGKGKRTDHEASALLSDDSTEWAKFAKPVKRPMSMMTNILSLMHLSEFWELCSDTRKRSRDKNCQRKKAKGDKKGAMEELRLAGVGVRKTNIWCRSNRLVMHLLMRRTAW